MSNKRRKVDLSVMSQTTEAERGWLAGIFDGEGCFSIQSHPSTNRVCFTMDVMVGMTHEPTIAKVASLLGLEEYHISRSKKSTKPQYRIEIQGLQAAVVVRFLRPYLVTKIEQADVLIKFAETLKDYIPSRHTLIPVEVWEKRRDLHEELRQWARPVCEEVNHVL